jgi:SNF2 family DNA or RNA helicase
MELNYRVERSRAIEPEFYRAPHPDNFTPREYQHAGVEYVLGRDHGLIGDAPGVGKTAQGIMVGNAIRAERTLVVCPASLRLNWQREIEAISTLPSPSTYPVLKSRDGISSEHKFVIISYALLANRNILRALLDLRWDHVILDEAHALKDPKGNTRTKAVCGWVSGKEYQRGLVDVTGRFTLLSGTILPNQPIECYNAIRLLDHSAINNMSLEAFRREFYEMGTGFVRRRVVNPATGVAQYKLQWSEQVRNVPTNLAELQRILRGNIMVRRLKDQVLSELPPKQWHPFPLEMTAGIKKALAHPGWEEAEKLYDLDPDAFDSGVPIEGAIATARRELGEAKAPAVVEFIKDLISSGVNKVVVSAWHKTVLQYLRRNLKSFGLVYIDGSTSASKKQEAVDAFQNDPSITIILGQMIPLGEGWTLTEAQDLVMAEADWVPGKNDQMLDRINRFGQQGDHTIGHVPVVTGSLDEKILSTAIAKDINIYKALDKI